MERLHHLQRGPVRLRGGNSGTQHRFCTHCSLHRPSRPCTRNSSRPLSAAVSPHLLASRILEER